MVTPGGHQAGGLAVGVAHRRDGPGDGDPLVRQREQGPFGIAAQMGPDPFLDGALDGLPVVGGTQFRQPAPDHGAGHPAGEPLRRPVPAQDVPAVVGGEQNVAGTLHHARQVAFDALDVLTQAHLLGDVLHQEQGVLHPVVPVERQGAVVISTHGDARGAEGHALGATLLVALEDALDAIEDAGAFDDGRRKDLIEAAPDGVLERAVPLVQEVAVGHDDAQPTVHQEGRRGDCIEKRTKHAFVWFSGAIIITQ